ncbi:MAG: NAD-dependent epimerase/dehydratase family protein [Chitinophagaceae bacterium]|jgi:nucleoside-diphosphate-sugar epimerase
MKILIAGGAGYIGSALVPKLLERGYEIDVIDLLWFGNHLPQEVKLLQKDIFDLTEEELKVYDQVMFLAGLSNDPMAEFSPAKNFIYNASSPSYLAYIAKRAGVRKFIYASSCSVYGYTVNELYDETAPAVSSYPYGISKLQGEEGVLGMADKDFSVICFRKGTVSGYSPRMRLDLIVNTMFKTAIDKGEVIVNNPSIWRPILSIDDAVSGYIRAIESSDGITGVFNLSSGNYTVGEVADLVKEAVEGKLGKSVKLNIRNVKDFRNYKVTNEKAITTLSFKPKHDVSAILDNLISNMDKFRDFENPNYYNIHVFKQIK